MTPGPSPQDELFACSNYGKRDNMSISTQDDATTDLLTATLWHASAAVQRKLAEQARCARCTCARSTPFLE